MRKIDMKFKEGAADKVYDVTEVVEVFGKFQIIQYFLIFLATIFITMIDINYVFVAGDLNYRCIVPECETANSTAEYPHWWPSSAQDRCVKPILKDGVQMGECVNTSFSGQLAECKEWIYERNNTVVAELHLACQPLKVNIIGTIHNIGMLVSMFFFGWVSDQYGRKPAMITCYVGSCIGHFKVLATSWEAYIAVEFFEACMTGGTYAAASVLMLEICGTQKRILSGVLFAYFIYFGESVFACIAMFVPYWKNIVHIIYTPSIFFICYIFLIYESPRWQIVKGKTEKAKNTIQEFARMNNLNINHEEWKQLDTVKLKEKFNIFEEDAKDSFTAAITSKEILKRLLVACTARFTVNFVYYGLMVNSVFLPGDKYVNFLLSTVMSFPGELISLYLMNKVGRKLPLIVGFFLTAVLCLGSGFVPDSLVWIKITLFLVGKMVSAACFTGIFTYTVELFPTSTRGSLLGAASIASRTGGMLAPLTPILNTISVVLPPIIFACSAILTGLLIFLTPETRDLPLMDTIQQIEDSVKKPNSINQEGTKNCETIQCGECVCSSF